MQIQESLRELFWNPTTLSSLPRLVLSLAVAAMLGSLLGLVYVRFGHALSDRRAFARNFLVLTVTTTLIITIVKSSLALSLGLVGALSIVRFRAAIKEPEELAYLFLAISVGLGLGAGQALVTIVALILILGLIIMRSLAKGGAVESNLYLTVISPASSSLGASQILAALSSVGATASLRRFDRTADALEAAFQVEFKAVNNLEEFTNRIREHSPAAKITCLDDRGLGV